MTKHFDLSDPLTARILGRSRSLFADDMAAQAQALDQAIRGRRILVVGAAGSIGHAFIRQLTAFRPAALHLVDINENSQVEVVRDLRSARGVFLPDDFRTISVDFGGPEFLHFVADQPTYDVFINFSAVKHVRSERDVYSLLRMIDVNVGALARFLDHPAGQRIKRIFSVSTDKSVRPANLMGATKNLMEKVLFERSGVTATSARFANVAFSAGSLLEGFERRLEKGQPLAAPSDVKRYFICHQEAGELCLLAAFLGQDRQVFCPRLDPSADLMKLSDIALAFLDHHGLTPVLCASEDEARDRAGHLPAGHWPCFFSASDTTGEKAFEEFHRPSDAIDRHSFAAVDTVVEAAPPPGLVRDFLAEIDAIRAQSHWSKGMVTDAIRRAVPELDHAETDRSLEQKM